MPLEAVENWRRAVVHQQALPVSPPQLRPSKRSSAQSTLPPVVPPKVDRSLSLSSSSSSALPSDAWSTASHYGGEQGTPSHALCAFRTGGSRCICRAASLGSTDAENSDLPSTSDEERRRKSASSATTVNDHPGMGGGRNMDPYHAKHCDTTGTADLGARKSGGSKYSGSKPGSKRSSGAGQSQSQSHGQGHIRSPSGGSSQLQPKSSTPVPFPSNVGSPNPSSTSKTQKRVSAPAPSRPQAHDYAFQPQPTHTPTPTYTTATNTPYGSLGRSATTGSAYHRSQPRTRGSPNPNVTPTPAQVQQGLAYDSLRSNATYTSSQNAFDSMRTPTSLYDPLSPPSTMPRPSRLPGGRQTRPLNSLWDAANVDAEVTGPKVQGQAPNRVFNYYTTPSGAYRKPTALVTSPRPNASANATPRQHDLDDQHSPTSADFSSGPIPQAQVGLGFGGSIPNGHGYVHPYVHAPGGPAHPQAPGYYGLPGSGSTASASTSPQSGHSQSGGLLAPGSPEHNRAPSWVSASTGWSRGRGRRRAPSDPSSTSGRATSTGPPVRPPLSTTGSSTFSTWTLVSPPPPSPVRPAPILLHPSRSAGSNTSRGGHSSRGHGHSQSVGGGQLRASTETNGSSTAVGSGSSGSKHGHGGNAQGKALSRTNSRTESFRRVRRNSLKAIGKFVSAVADAFGRLPSGQGEGGVRSPRVG